MKLFFMKQQAVDYIKTNIKTLYIHYYNEQTNDWIKDVLGYDPFELFKEIPDFELERLSDKKGEIECENSRKLYSNLISISPSQATDERLWAGLCNSTFYSYVRNRWDYNDPIRSALTDAKKDSDKILSRFFFKGGVVSGKFRNTLSKCWWVGHNVYLPNSDDQFELLDALGSEDFSTKVNDIFYSYSFSSNKTIVIGIIKAWKEITDKYGNLQLRPYLRPAIQYLNALGGSVLLDLYDEREIQKIIFEYISMIKEGKNRIIIPDPKSIEDEEIDLD